MSGLTHTVTADRRSRPFTFAALIAAVLTSIHRCDRSVVGLARSGVVGCRDRGWERER